ncbi:MAG: mechanosensitive ion channel family protein [Austwickia sp.]|jgi:small-conductance mechanosensitive channel|nr:MAG: mechanosensitive ion channel family protein [Austwickia sp.]
MHAVSAREVSAEALLAWLLNQGLTILLIVVVALATRWLLHRLINRVVASLSVPKPARTAAASDGTASAGTASGTSSTPATAAGRAEDADPGRIPTEELPTVRRHARLAARALEGSFLNPERQRQRVETLGSVLRSITTVILFVIAVLMIGDELGFNMAPVLASAGVGGVALGFGAQSLVKDFLSGMFMLAEDQYGVGDLIDVDNVTGTVEEVTLRVTRLRDGDGVIWYVRNGEITRLANKTQGWSTATVDIPVGFGESPERVIEVLRTAMAAMDADDRWEDLLLEEPKVVGVEATAPGTFSVRIVAKCAPNEHWGVQREIRERSLIACADAGIKPPPTYPPYGGNPT